MGVHRYGVDVGGDEITVMVTGDGIPRAVEVTCEPRPTDGDRLWFWTHWGDPLAEAEDITGACVELVGLMATSA